MRLWVDEVVRDSDVFDRPMFLINLHLWYVEEGDEDFAAATLRTFLCGENTSARDTGLLSVAIRSA